MFERLTAAVCASLLVMPAGADWINLTGAETAPNIAEIYVLDDHVRINLEVYVGNLDTFAALVPDDWMREGTERSPEAKRMQRFAEATLQVIDDRGNRLPAELRLVEARMRTDRQSPFAGMINPFTRQRVPEAPADKRVLYAELVYPFTQRPAVLTFIPPRDEEGRSVVSIGFIAYHKSVPVIDFRYLGAPARLTLDWDDPWYSKFDNPNLKRHHKSALMSFLYVEPYEVRHEILTRVRDLEQWMDLGLRDDEYIEVDELEPLKQRIGEFLLTRNQVLVDGRSLKPILDRSSYVKVALTGIQLLEQPERLEVSTAIVGVIITYLTQGMPREVTVDWDLFTEQVQRVPATAIDPAGPLLTYVEPSDPVHKWTNYLKNYVPPTVQRVVMDESLTHYRVPLVSMLCLAALVPLGWRIQRTRRRQASARGLVIAAAGFVLAGLLSYPFAQVSVARPAALAPGLADADVQGVLEALLQNVYRAFDFRDEQDVYDKLALSISGELLADIYLQSRKSLEIQKAGGAQAKVKEVRVLEAAVNDRPESGIGQRIRAQWTALGTVGHWGHVHTRRNVYDALVNITGVDGHWKITGLELLEEKRVDPFAPEYTRQKDTAAGQQGGEDAGAAGRRQGAVLVPADRSLPRR